MTQQTQHEQIAVETSLIPQNRGQRTEAIRMAYEKLSLSERKTLDRLADSLRDRTQLLGQVGAREVLAALGQYLNHKMPEDA